MTTAVASKTRTGRSLVTDAEFDMLASFCADEYGLERCVADRVIDQAGRLLDRRVERARLDLGGDATADQALTPGSTASAPRPYPPASC